MNVRGLEKTESYPRKIPWSSVPAERVGFRAGRLISKSALRFPGKQLNSNVIMCLRYSLKPPEITAEEEAKLTLREAIKHKAG
jgi:hypothetical protein